MIVIVLLDVVDCSTDSCWSLSNEAIFNEFADSLKIQNAFTFGAQLRLVNKYTYAYAILYGSRCYI